MIKIHKSSNEGSINVIRAKYVFVKDDRLYAVYDTEVDPSALRSVALQLALLPGVEAGTARAVVGKPDAPRTPVLWMRVLPAFSAEAAQVLFEQLTKPELAIAIAYLEVRFTGCRCGRTDYTINGPTFLPEFDPEDIELFDLRLFAALQELDIWPFVNAQPRPPYEPLITALNELLAKLGAYATNLYVKPRYNPNQECRHGDS
jgi:hypothetical protein